MAIVLSRRLNPHIRVDMAVKAENGAMKGRPRDTRAQICAVISRPSNTIIPVVGYGTLRTWAEELGLREAVGLLEATLKEEKKAGETLTAIAERCVNQAAQQEAAE
jgi:hypothetical protein